jgi:hypothetical protein
MGNSSKRQRSHLYNIGEMVTFDPRGASLRGPLGIFSVLAQLPREGSDFQYRIKSENESHQRVAAEHQLMRSLPAVN